VLLPSPVLAARVVWPAQAATPATSQSPATAREGLWRAGVPREIRSGVFITIVRYGGEVEHAAGRENALPTVHTLQPMARQCNTAWCKCWAALPVPPTGLAGVLQSSLHSSLATAFLRRPSRRASPNHADSADFMRGIPHIIIVVAAAAALGACGSSTTAPSTEQYFGRWERVGGGLPPVVLAVRREGGATVGQVWLSGVTYTLPATFNDTSVVLADPASSKLAPFVGVIKSAGTMRATLRGEPDLVVELQRVSQ
jgi:hypothetical protein